MANRFIIGKGELLTYDISAPPMFPNKVHPYTLEQAQQILIPQIATAAAELAQLPREACPFDLAVVKLQLHPAYISKSYFPRAVLREAGLVSIGSRTIRLRPRYDTRKTAPSECETTELFVAGSRSALDRLPALAGQLDPDSPAGNQFRQIENFFSMTPVDRVKQFENYDGKVFEVGLHLAPGHSSTALRDVFAAFARQYGFTVNPRYEFPVGGMLFVAVEGPASGLDGLAQFTLLRVVRPMPKVRSARPIARSSAVAVGCTLPVADPLSSEPKVAILDGGLPDQHVLTPYVNHYERSDPDAADVPDYLEHGLGVTSAVLFGPVEPGGNAARPFAPVDHYRVLDTRSDEEDPYELYRTLGHIEEVLLTRQYQFINLSLGPDLPYEDSDVHAWTAVLDNLLSDGETLMTVAVGNNGERDAELFLDRIQVPADSVNALSIGAANHSGAGWARAGYSAKGPGRSPGRRKPDAVAFGGCGKEYFHVIRSGPRPELAATMGTSFASPFALRTGIGVRAILGADVDPLTIKALLLHAADGSAECGIDEIGWGRIASEVANVITCGDGIARIIYQGRLRPGKYLRAPIPLPTGELEGKVKITATFCFASPVDVENAACYTKAGLGITFRPHAGKLGGREAKTRSFFTATKFRTEQEQRSDLGKWETVLHATDNFFGTSLQEPCFDIHYNAREGGDTIGAGADWIRYALVVTVEAKKHLDLYDRILADHVKLKELQAQVSLPIRI